MVYKSNPRAWLPACCVLCGVALHGLLDLCAACANELPLHRDGCPRCAMPLEGAGGVPCGQCQRQPPRFDACLAALRYDYPVREAIGRFKFHGELAAGRVLALLLARRIAALGLEYRAGITLVPVPLHPTRLAERGFNQSERIARVLARELALPMAPAWRRAHGAPMTRRPWTPRHGDATSPPRSPPHRAARNASRWSTT